MNSTKLRQYYRLAKPGIVYGNLLTAAAAFAFAVHHAPHAAVSGTLFLAMAAGLSLCIAAACVTNNVIERDTDARMERTKDRALVTREISVEHALLFALLLAVVGFAVLYQYTNLYAFGATLFGVVAYVAFYTPSKRITVHSTAIGSLAGAVPPVVGYLAVSPAMDTNALLLFLILVCWQMPHFFAIALYREEEYRNAGLPVMPMRIGRVPTQALMTLYTFLFAATAFILGILDQLSRFYAVAAGVISLGWILLAISGFRAEDTPRWARRMFLYSLIVILAFSALIALA